MKKYVPVLFLCASGKLLQAARHILVCLKNRYRPLRSRGTPFVSINFEIFVGLAVRFIDKVLVDLRFIDKVRVDLRFIDKVRVGLRFINKVDRKSVV